ncbi:MAG: hypothetical protein C0518_15215 [Opitutus sp.]|nr:hypothetical protein [Opitutus sp.]
MNVNLSRLLLVGLTAALELSATPSSFFRSDAADTLRLEQASGENFAAMDAAGNLLPHPLDAIIFAEDGVPSNMVLVPASAAGSVPAFLAGRYEVTNAEFLEFIRSTGYAHLPGGWVSGRFPRGHSNFPVTGLTVAEATAYCDWLTVTCGRHFSLPTSEQIARLSESATRTGTDSAGLDSVGGNRHDVNSWGCYDVLGNAQEMTLESSNHYRDQTLGFRVVSTPAPAFGMVLPEAVRASVIVTAPTTVPTDPGAANYWGPTFVLHPQSQIVRAGDSVTLSARAIHNYIVVGGGEIFYQWYFNNQAIAGATAPTLTIGAVQSNAAGVYHAVAAREIPPESGNILTAISDPAVIAIESSGTPPAITRQPATSVVLIGETALVTATFSGTPPLAVRWRVRERQDPELYYPVHDLTGFQFTNSDSSATVSYRNPPATKFLSLELAVFNAYGTVTSSAAEIRVLAQGIAPTITNHPRDQRVSRGASVSLQVVADGAPTPSLQWFLGGTALSGATSDTLTLSNVQDAQIGSYTVTATNSLGSVTSTPAVISFATASPPVTAASGSGGGGGGSPSVAGTLALLTILARRALRLRDSPALFALTRRSRV